MRYPLSPGSRPYRILLDPEAPASSHRLEVREDTPAGMVAAALFELLSAHPDLDGVELVVDGEPAGTSSRRRVESLVDASGPVRGDAPVGAGDGASLPGPPSRFVAFTFSCAHCGERAYRIAADDDPPQCRTPGHGPMEQRE